MLLKSDWSPRMIESEGQSDPNPVTISGNFALFSAINEAHLST